MAARPAPGSMIGADALIPAELVAELAHSAKLVPLVHPADAAPEAGYIPSQALADFVRCRDLTCRFPGCDRPAMRLRHRPHHRPTPTAGRPMPPTSNAYAACIICSKRSGAGVTNNCPTPRMIWTSPSGQTYITTPGSALLFPGLCAPTGALDPIPHRPRCTRPRRDDAQTPTHPRPKPRPLHRRRTPTQPPGATSREQRREEAADHRQRRTAALLGKAVAPSPSWTGSQSPRSASEC